MNPPVGNANPEPEFITAHAAHKLTGISKYQLQRLAIQGVVKTKETAFDRLLFSRTDVTEFAKRRGLTSPELPAA